MKVVLAQPNAKAHTITPPLGLGYLAACVRQHGHEVTIVDMAKKRIGTKKGVLELAALEPDLIGISVLSTAYLQARELIAETRFMMPDVPIVVGGPHITAVPQDSLLDLGVSAGVLGEGESVFPGLVDALAEGLPLNGMPSLCIGKGTEAVCTERADFLKDLDSLPFPAWDLIDPRTYPDLPHQLLNRRFPVAPVITSRGCPFDCTFCASTTLWGRGWRTRSPENVVDEIEMLVKDYQVREIHIEDDNFTLKRSHAAAVCEEILRRGLDISWCTPNGVRIDSLDEELVALMRRSGCYRLGFGVESGSQRVLDYNNKKLDLDRVAAVVEMVRRHGIETHSFFILGLPGETRETIRETIGFARRIPFDRANFALLSPLPGSEIYQKYVLDADDSGKVDYESFNYFTPFPLGDISADELKKWQRRSVFSFFGRPHQMWNLVRHTRPSQIKEVVKAMVSYST